MMESRAIMTGVVVAAGAAVLVLILLKARRAREEVDQAVLDIEGELDALDPVARAVTVARLESDAVRSGETARS